MWAEEIPSVRDLRLNRKGKLGRAQSGGHLGLNLNPSLSDHIALGSSPNLSVPTSLFVTGDSIT